MTFHDRVARECGITAKGLRQVADRLREVGLAADAALVATMAERMAKLGHDALCETQPIPQPVLDEDTKPLGPKRGTMQFRFSLPGDDEDDDA